MEHISLDIDIVAIVGGFIFTIIWLVRLEAKVLYLSKAFDSHAEDMNDVKEKLDKISDSLARLEGKLGY